MAGGGRKTYGRTGHIETLPAREQRSQRRRPRHVHGTQKKQVAMKAHSRVRDLRSSSQGSDAGRGGNAAIGRRPGLPLATRWESKMAGRRGTLPRTGYLTGVWGRVGHYVTVLENRNK
jgi:hypothetical protein